MKGSPQFRSRELAIKTRIGRENTNSRRFSASSIREDTNSFRSNITISSSTVSSPGYTAREEIDPSTYSFTTALKALQAKARLVDNWEIKGVALNSKWNEAEKYISNPLSGQVPMECLSSKTLSARITMSAPLIYPSRSPLIQTTPYSIPTHEDVLRIPIKVAEKKVENRTRDVGVQSTPAELTSPPMEQDSIKCSAKKSDSPKLKYETQVEAKKAYKDEEETKRKGKGDVEGEGEGEGEGKKGIQGGCLSLSFRSLWRQREKHKSKKQVCSLFTISMYAKQNLKAS